MAMESLIEKMESNFTLHNTPVALNIWYDHMSYFKTRVKNAILSITDHQCIKFEGDYWGLLADLKIPARYHAFLTAYNGYDHPSSYKGTSELVYIPDFEELESVLKVNLTREV